MALRDMLALQAAQVPDTLTGELAFPLAETLLLHAVEVRQVVMSVLQCILLQIKRGQTSRRIPASEHTIRAL